MHIQYQVQSSGPGWPKTRPGAPTRGFGPRFEGLQGAWRLMAVGGHPIYPVTSKPVRRIATRQPQVCRELVRRRVHPAALATFHRKDIAMAARMPIMIMVRHRTRSTKPLRSRFHSLLEADGVRAFRRNTARWRSTYNSLYLASAGNKVRLLALELRMAPRQRS